MNWNIWIWRLTSAYRRLFKRMNFSHPKVLELGSGSGVNSLEIAKNLEPEQITLVDSNDSALEFSKRTFKNTNFNVKYLKASVLDLDLKEKFDLVHSEGLCEHFYGKDREKIFKTHADFCKENGFVIIFVPYKCISYYLNKKILMIRNKWIWDEEPFSKKELYALCEQNNLEVLKKTRALTQIGILARKR
jgi:ubiquinone/menaquinone biosynthesis C-methylase UbiE